MTILNSLRAAFLFVAYRTVRAHGRSGAFAALAPARGGWQMRDFGQRELRGVSIEGLPLHVDRSLIELGNQG
jgi:hypothetical protein